MKRMGCFIWLLCLIFFAATSCKPFSSDNRSESKDTEGEEQIRKYATFCQDEVLSEPITGKLEEQYLNACNLVMEYFGKYADYGSSVIPAFIGKVTVAVAEESRKKSMFNNFISGRFINDIMFAAKKAASDIAKHVEETWLEFRGCKYTPAAFGEFAVLGKTANSRKFTIPLRFDDNGKQIPFGKQNLGCLEFLRKNYGKGLFKGSGKKQFEFVVVEEQIPDNWDKELAKKHGVEFIHRQCIRITGSVHERSAIFCYKKPLPPFVRLIFRWDSWKKNFSNTAVFATMFEFGIVAEMMAAAQAEMHIKEKNKNDVPMRMGGITNYWLKKQMQGARRLVYGVTAGVALSIVAIGPAIAAMGSSLSVVLGTTAVTGGKAVGLAAKSWALVKLIGLGAATFITPFSVPIQRMAYRYSDTDTKVIGMGVTVLQWLSVMGAIYGTATLLKSIATLPVAAWNKLTGAKTLKDGVDGLKQAKDLGNQMGAVKETTKTVKRIAGANLDKASPTGVRFYIGKMWRFMHRAKGSEKIQKTKNPRRLWGWINKGKYGGAGQPGPYKNIQLVDDLQIEDWDNMNNAQIWYYMKQTNPLVGAKGVNSDPEEVWKLISQKQNAKKTFFQWLFRRNPTKLADDEIFIMYTRELNDPGTKELIELFKKGKIKKAWSAEDIVKFEKITKGVHRATNKNGKIVNIVHNPDVASAHESSIGQMVKFQGNAIKTSEEFIEVSSTVAKESEQAQNAGGFFSNLRNARMLGMKIFGAIFLGQEAKKKHEEWNLEHLPGIFVIDNGEDDEKYEEMLKAFGG